MAIAKMNIKQATRSYEGWMRSCATIIESHVRLKHTQMKSDPFMFFRGTFYRWAQLWPQECADLCDAPQVLAVGDLHVGSFGTWRDAEGRLSWGVDDFDESYPLPYTNDLVRLAASVKMVIDSETLRIKLREGCDAILEGYEQALKDGGCPIVLAERERNIEKLGIAALKPPQDFWKKLELHPAVNGLPRHAKQALEKTLPDKNLDYKVVRREAGMGSLGQQRFVAIAEWEGGCIAREAKEMVPPACEWLNGNVSHCQSYYQRAIRSAVRSHDPYQRIVDSWLIRRLSPDSNPIEMEDLSKERDEETLLHAMGSEAANVHLGNGRQVKRIIKDLHRRKSNWLRSAAKDMAKTMEREWKEYRKS
jgi:Uncharacterized protein conserved in bacteria (DUF2252)